MLETPSSLLVMLLLTHVVADFILPFKRVMASPTFRARWLRLPSEATFCCHAWHELAVGRTVHLLTSTSVGCSMTMARAIAWAPLAILRVSRISARQPPSEMLYPNSDSVPQANYGNANITAHLLPQPFGNRPLPILGRAVHGSSRADCIGTDRGVIDDLPRTLALHQRQLLAPVITATFPEGFAHRHSPSCY